MAAVQLQTVVGRNGILTVRGLPSFAGHKVEVLVRDAARKRGFVGKYPLRGKPVRYVRPFDGVAAADWKAGR